jgi:hypothetical protein
MRGIIRKKFSNVIYAGPPDGVEAFVSLTKIVWGLFILLVRDEYLSKNIFYFGDDHAVSCVIGTLLILDGILKIWAWITDRIRLRRILSGIGMCFWIFVWLNTYFSDLPKFTLIQFTVLIICDFWLYLRLGVLRNDKSS